MAARRKPYFEAYAVGAKPKRTSRVAIGPRPRPRWPRRTRSPTGSAPNPFVRPPRPSRPWPASTWRAPARSDPAPAARRGRSIRADPRERDVLPLIVKGWTNRQIADSLFISENTAGVHVSNILGKLGVSTRTEAAGIAARLGLGIDP